MKYIKTKWFVFAVLLAAIGILTAFKFETGKAPQFVSEKVQQGNIENSVQATGSITAVTTVQVGSQVSGTIQTLNADFNSHVKKDQIVAQIDPSLFKGALLQAQADLQDANANLQAAKANLEKAQAAEVQTHLDYTRSDQLAQAGVIPVQQLDAAKAAWQSAAAAVNAGKAQVTQSAAQVQQKAAAVTVARTNLDHTTIRSPIDGTVVARSVDVGQTVAASLQAPTLFTIAQDLTKMQVYVSTDESDVGAIRTGQPVTFKVDAFPTESFTGRVSQVRLNATTVQNVVTYTTVVDFDNPQMKLFPGMTAYVTIPVATADNVMKVPNAALRFTPQTDAAKTQSAQGGQQRKQKDPTVTTVWKLDANKTLEPVQIKTGITDHTFTQVEQVLKGSLNPGDTVVTGAATAQRASTAGSSTVPGLGGNAARGARVGR
ncbi:MAG: efflux RND transporter periplasmic adaptor subunit [Candidatus Angelobacter sp. Gp1-AA117]|nr:MAG: efflux RND transporter periplasmic adaptor subunit [Candidatus Angelobacter sp. Gp1-AA117]